jgi:hypothetical protein
MRGWVQNEQVDETFDLASWQASLKEAKSLTDIKQHINKLFLFTLPDMMRRSWRNHNHVCQPWEGGCTGLLMVLWCWLAVVDA